MRRCSSTSCSTSQRPISQWLATSSPRSKRTSSSESPPTQENHMPSEKQIVEAFDRVANETPGYIPASLVDLESGMTLGLKSLRQDFDLAAASAYNKIGRAWCRE